MLSRLAACILVVCFSRPGASVAEDLTKAVKKAVELGTLGQNGTHPFHLVAELSPISPRDASSGRTGRVEIWWDSPARWRQEIQSPEFRQVQIVRDGHVWQQNTGDYFPEWLREIAESLIHPVPLSPEILKLIRDAEVKHLMGTTHLSWALMSSDGTVQKGMGAGISINDSSGLISTANGLGWSAWLRDYKDFHGRKVAMLVNSAKITVLEDLGAASDSLFDTSSAGDAQPLSTVVLDELTLRRSLLPMGLPSWPPVQDGPLEGVLTTEVVVDRTGKVRNIGTIVSDNPGMNEAARTRIAAMVFQPFELNGIPVQVVSRVTMPFKASRPAGSEAFESARTYFERGRRNGFPAAAGGKPYILRADFTTKSSSGEVETGHYEDTWISDSQWRREITLGSSRCIRTRNGEKAYKFEEGPYAGTLRFLMQAMEPIPAIDTFVESDWRIKSDLVDGTKTVRVLTGYESPEGKLDSEHARGFWFDADGNLVKAFFNGMEVRRDALNEYEGVRVSRQIRVLKDGALAVLIEVTEIVPAGDMPKSTFETKGHEWTRSFTSEVR